MLLFRELCPSEKLAVQQGGSLLNRVITHLGAQCTIRPYVASHPAFSSACAVGSTLVVRGANI